MKLIYALALSVAFLPGSVGYAAQKLGQPQAARAPDEIYAKTCGYCHGKNVGPVIRGRALPVEAITLMVRAGPNGMPAFRPTEITDAELGALAAWISASKADPLEKGR